MATNPLINTGGTLPAPAAPVRAAFAARRAHAEAELLRDPTQADRRIARAADVDTSVVGKLRAALVAAGRIASVDVRIGGDGIARNSAKRRPRRERLAEIRAALRQGRTFEAIAREQEITLRRVQELVAEGAQSPPRRWRLRQSPPAVDAERASPRGRPRAERVKALRAYIAQGFNVEQIAAALELSPQRVRDLMRAEGVKIAMPKRGRPIDPARIVRTSVATIAGVAHGLNLAHGFEVPATEATELLAELREAEPALEALRRQLKELADEQRTCET